MIRQNIKLIDSVQNVHDKKYKIHISQTILWNHHCSWGNVRGFHKLFLNTHVRINEHHSVKIIFQGNAIKKLLRTLRTSEPAMFG